MQISETTGLILAGGRSTRMGTDKANLAFQGTRFLDHAVHLVRQTGVDDIHILGGQAGLADSQPFAGPAQAIGGFLRRHPLVCNILVLPIDMPGLTVPLLAALIAHPRGGYYEGQYLPFAARAITPDTMLENIPVRMRDLLAALEIPCLPMPAGQETAFANINTPADYQALRP